MLEFSAVSPKGRIKSNTIGVFVIGVDDNFSFTKVIYFTSKRKTLNLAEGLNPSLIKRRISTEVCKRLYHGGTTTTYYELVHDGLIAKWQSGFRPNGRRANALKGLNHIIPTQVGEIGVSHSGNVIS